MSPENANVDLMKRFSMWMASRGEAEAEDHLRNATMMVDWAAGSAGKGPCDLEEREMMQFMYEAYIRDTDGRGRQVSLLPDSLVNFYRYLKLVEGFPESRAALRVCQDKARYRHRLETYRTLDPGSRDYAEQMRRWKDELEEWIAAVPGASEASPAPGFTEFRVETVTVFVAALNGFLEFSSNQPPLATAERLDAFYRECGDAVVRWGGEVAKCMGDGVLAYFQEKETENAIRACIQLDPKVKQLCQSWNAPGLGFGVGIHVGRVVMGIFGHPSRRSFDMIGNTVALTALMARRAKLLISQSAYKGREAAVDVKEHHTFDVAWARQILRAVELRGQDG